MKSKLLIAVLSLCGLFTSTIGSAEIAEVYSWKANPGKGAAMMQSMATAKAIQEKLGIHVEAYATTMGTDGFVDYVLRYDSLEAWGAARDALNASPEWNAYWVAAQENSAGALLTSITGINMDPDTKADSFGNDNVYNAFIWKAAPGQEQAVIKRFAQAKEIHESTGARVETYAGGIGAPNQFHYVVFAASWAELAASQAKLMQNKEWAAFTAERDPTTSTMIGSFSGQRIPF